MWNKILKLFTRENSLDADVLKLNALVADVQEKVNDAQVAYARISSAKKTEEDSKSIYNKIKIITDSSASIKSMDLEFKNLKNRPEDFDKKNFGQQNVATELAIEKLHALPSSIQNEKSNIAKLKTELKETFPVEEINRARKIMKLGGLEAVESEKCINAKVVADNALNLVQTTLSESLLEGGTKDTIQKTITAQRFLLKEISPVVHTLRQHLGNKPSGESPAIEPVQLSLTPINEQSNTGQMIAPPETQVIVGEATATLALKKMEKGTARRGKI